MHYKQNAKCVRFNLNELAFREMRLGKAREPFPEEPWLHIFLSWFLQLCLEVDLKRTKLARRNIKDSVACAITH